MPVEGAASWGTDEVELEARNASSPRETFEDEVSIGRNTSVDTRPLQVVKQIAWR